MASKADTDEYLLNDFGIIFVGTKEAPEPREWYYEQFKKASFDATMFVLDRSGLTPRQRGSAVAVSRMLSQLVGSRPAAAWESSRNSILTQTPSPGELERRERHPLRQVDRALLGRQGAVGVARLWRRAQAVPGE